MHILSQVTDNFSSWVSGRERMTVEKSLDMSPKSKNKQVITERHSKKCKNPSLATVISLFLSSAMHPLESETSFFQMETSSIKLDFWDQNPVQNWLYTFLVLKQFLPLNRILYSCTQCFQDTARGYKTVFMLNSAENEICSTSKQLNTNNLNFFHAKQSWAWIFSC